MLKTKKPSAIIYGLEEKGTLTLMSDVYFEENLQEEVIVLRSDYKKLNDKFIETLKNLNEN